MWAWGERGFCSLAARDWQGFGGWQGEGHPHARTRVLMRTRTLAHTHTHTHTGILTHTHTHTGILTGTCTQMSQLPFSDLPHKKCPKYTLDPKFHTFDLRALLISQSFVHRRGLCKCIGGQVCPPLRPFGSLIHQTQSRLGL